MTHSISLNVQINFDFEIDGPSYKEALAEAIRLAFRPDFASISNGVMLDRVTVLDPDCGSVVSDWDSRRNENTYEMTSEESNA